MSQDLSLHHLKAWEMFITRQPSVLRNIEQALAKEKSALPLHWYDVLLVLNRAPKKRMRLSEIADRIVTSRSALTRSVDKLESKGYLKKETAPEDQRGQYALITEKGREAVKETWAFYREALRENFGQHLSEKEAETLEKLLRKLPASGTQIVD